MKIGIDARFWGIEHTGIGRYVMELIKNLEQIDHKNDYFIFLRKKYYEQLKFKNPGFQKVLAEYPHYSLAEQTGFLRLINRNKLDLIHFPHFNLPIFYQGNYLVTIHDLIKHESRGRSTTTRYSLFYWIKYLAYLIEINAAVSRAKKLIVPSQWWKNKIKNRFNLDDAKLTVTYESVSREFIALAGAVTKEQVKVCLEKYEIKTPFIIYTGNLYPHKNVVRLLEAVKAINQTKKLHLVIVCAKSIFWQRIKKEVERLDISGLVNLAGFVPDRELVVLYQAAEAFVFPSLLEGFGLPGLEAMAAGLPVVCSNTSSLPEIYGKAAIYFNPRKVNDIKNKILKLIDSPSLKKELITRGNHQLNNYSWEKMARQTLEIYWSFQK